MSYPRCFPSNDEWPIREFFGDFFSIGFELVNPLAWTGAQKGIRRETRFVFGDFRNTPRKTEGLLQPEFSFAPTCPHKRTGFFDRSLRRKYAESLLTLANGYIY